MQTDSALPLADLKAALASGPRLRLAIVFGSGASGRMHQASDIDIAIIPEDATLLLREELRLQVELTRVAGRNVDLVRLDRAPTLVRYQVAKHGVALFESGPFEAARFKAAAVSEYLDFEPSLRRAAEVFRRRVAAGDSSPKALGDEFQVAIANLK
ncbi:MAG TPA: nucleotidyltransferase domain-containing protein [Polyangiaceae bacterium]|nr:nucleotidyltransferase domain-containing protein [Polyangiaceae bacterium]